MLNVAIIGAGIGAQHADGYVGLPDAFRVHTICDLNEARGRSLAEAHGSSYSSDLETVLNDDSIDIIDICLPPHLHFQTATRALDAGKHVVCEKPLASSIKEADALIAKSLDTGRQVFPIFQYRFGIGTAQLRALQASGLAGRCFAGTLETHWDRDAAYYDVDWRGTWAGEQGGAILGHAIHIHDLLPSILGPISQVYAQVATRVNAIEVEDCAAVTMRMEDGALVTSSVTLGAAENTSRLKIMFEGFTVESDHAPYAPAAQPWRFVARPPIQQSEIDAVLAGIEPVSSRFQGLLYQVSAALAGADHHAVTLEDGRRSLELVTAIYHSARTHAPVDLPLGPDHPLYGGWLP
jgi:predicted dehydrogenase